MGSNFTILDYVKCGNLWGDRVGDIRELATFSPIFVVVFEQQRIARGENFEEISLAMIFHFLARSATWREIFPRYVAATASWINHFFRVTIKYPSDRPCHVTQVRGAAGFKRGNIGRSEGLINHDTTKITIHRDKMGAILFFLLNSRFLCQLKHARMFNRYD